MHCASYHAYPKHSAVDCAREGEGSSRKHPAGQSATRFLLPALLDDEVLLNQAEVQANSSVPVHSRNWTYSCSLNQGCQRRSLPSFERHFVVRRGDGIPRAAETNHPTADCND
uniref:(northern house mosquito) hypothetical protein n=1 Tax=Culex pipiens TaxID=7175 RepID=A0A8D8E4S9_CULPI